MRYLKLFWGGREDTCVQPSQLESLLQGLQDKEARLVNEFIFEQERPLL